MRRRVCSLALFVLALFVSLAEAGPGPDLAEYVDFARFMVPPLRPVRDLKTGFLVGGRNSTESLRTLTEINGQPIAKLEADMRPGAKVEVGSDAGFLGPEEKLLDVLAGDNQLVVDELGLTHQELAKHLHALGSVAAWQADRGVKGEPFVYHGRRFKVTRVDSRGTQLSPFRDGTESGSNVTVKNLESGKTLSYGLLCPYMIERYGFYEGKGTPYRVDPRAVADVLDFLKPRLDGR